jgi:hypothetical protein
VSGSPTQNLASGASAILRAVADCLHQTEPHFRGMPDTLLRVAPGKQGMTTGLSKRSSPRKPTPMPSRPPSDLDRARARRESLRHDVVLSEKAK